MFELIFLSRNLFDSIKDTGVGSCKVSYALLKDKTNYKIVHLEVKDRWSNTISSAKLQEHAKKQFTQHVFVGNGVVEIQKRDTYPGPSNLVLSKPHLENSDMGIETLLKAAKLFSKIAKESWGFNPPITIKEYCFS